jgi:type IX secretion system PorP/SprF family membrane protein
MFRNVISFFVSSFFFLATVLGQNNSITQWNNLPLNFNPAFTGFYNGEMRVVGFHRTLSDKGLSDINTSQISLEYKPFNNLLLNENDEWGFALSANKISSLKGVYSATNLVFGTAYHKALDYDGKLNLSIGFQGKLRSDKINLNSLLFTSQFDETGFNNALPNNENSQNYNHSYFDFNSGILFSAETESEFFLLGLSAQQLNFAKRTMYGDPKIDPMIHFTLGYTKYINNNSLISLSGNFGHNTPVNEKNIMIGYGTAITDLTDDLLTAGFYYRFNEVVSPFVEFQKKGVKLTLSYDSYVTPKINSLTIRRGIEISAIFRFSSLSDNSFNNVNLGCFK